MYVIFGGMIIETTKKNIQSSGNIQSASCTIDAEDMRYIASLLRNNYSDTMLATMREIIANGIDVSNGRKVDVQLPTRLEPNFIVRDYGCGLSEEDMMGLYTKYGKSTKRDSNNAIGGFGIGRFAPLSYADSFIVVSVCDGQKTSYSIRVDENDDTVVSKMYSESTYEDNGIYVQVPIKNADLNDFILKFKNFSQYLADKIHLLNEEFDQKLPNFSTDVFDLYIREGYYDRNSITSSPKVLMGGILYPVVQSSQKYPAFVDGVVYKAEIGEFKLHHSREALEYNDKTVEALRKASDKILECFKQKSEDELKDCKTLYEATELFSKTLSVVSNALGNKMAGGLWQGHKVTNEIFDWREVGDCIKVTRGNTGNVSCRKITRSWDYAGEPNKNRFFVIDDGVTPRAPHNRLSWVKENQTVILIGNASDEILAKVKAMNSPQVTLLSEHERTVPSRKRLKGQKDAVRKGDILEFSKGGWGYNNANFWSETDEEFSDDKTYYYYVYYANKVECEDGYLSDPAPVARRVDQLKKINPKLEKVYGVRKKALKKIEKKSNWIRMEKMEENWINNSPILKVKKKKEALGELLEDFDRLHFIEALKKAPSKKVILNFKKLLEDYNKLEVPCDAPNVSLKGIHMDISKESKIKEDFVSSYPMVKHIGGYSSRQNMTEDLANYLAKW